MLGFWVCKGMWLLLYIRSERNDAMLIHKEDCTYRVGHCAADLLVMNTYACDEADVCSPHGMNSLTLMNSPVHFPAKQNNISMLY